MVYRLQAGGKKQKTDKNKVSPNGRDVTALTATIHGCGTAISLLGLFFRSHPNCHSYLCHATKRKWG